MSLHMGHMRRCGKVHFINTSPIIKFSRSGGEVYRFNCRVPRSPGRVAAFAGRATSNNLELDLHLRSGFSSRGLVFPGLNSLQSGFGQQGMPANVL